MFFNYISTDKAFNPTSVMGAAKRVREMLMRYYQGRSSTAFISVRFGNVLGSKGRVLEVFERQLNLGKPITITDPNMERYFMSIPEAVSLMVSG
jgi:FlaA1/EpsC-like NDP-sugar epimerase